MNLGLSEKFGHVDYDKLIYPAIMTVDYIRVYQDPDLPNVTCDPRKRMTLCFGYFTTHPPIHTADFPTQTYIETCVLVPFLS